MNETKPRQVVEEDLGIDLYDLFYLFRQKLPGILISLVAGGILVGLFTFFFIAPKYEATSKLYIVSSSTESVVNFADLQLGASLTKDYEELVLSRPMMESVLANLDLDVGSAKALERMVTVTNPSNTRILCITVTSTSPQEAMDIANEIARLSVDWLPEIMQTRTPSVPEQAVLPEQKASPSYFRNTILGALAFMAAYYAIVVIRYLHDDTVRSSEDVERYFGIVPLTSIPEEKDVYDHAESDEGRGGSLKSHRSHKSHKSHKSHNKGERSA